MKLHTAINRFLKDESGASMVEYGVALLVVAAVGVTAMNTLGTVTQGAVSTACTAMGGANC